MRSWHVSKAVLGSFVAALLVFCTMPAAVKAEQVDNPQFKAWSKCDVGASVTFTSTMMGQNGQNLSMELTRKLVEKADDHVVIEVSMNVTMPGAPAHQIPSHKMTINAKTDKVDITDDGKEDVKADDGKMYSCEVFEGKGANPRHPDAKGKFWINEDVPGGIVKMEGGDNRASVTFLLKSFTTK